MNRRNKTAFCILLSLILLLSSCGGSASTTSETTPAVAENVVIDCAGREVVIPDQVDSVACLYAYTGHVCVMLCCEDKIDAVVNGLKRDNLMQRKIPDIMDMPCPYGGGSINIEELTAVSPDLVLLRVENLADSGEIQKLESVGIPYVVVDYVSMADQVYSIEVMGKALGEEERAATYLEYYRSTLAMLDDRLSKIPENQRKRVYHSVNEVVRTDIPGTLSYEVLEAAGCINVVTSSDELRLDGDKGMVTVEQIYVWDPDLILANEPDATEYFRTDDKFSGLRAVQGGNVHQLPVGISRWGHPGSLESPLAALYIAKLLYPDIFQDIDMTEEVRSFYALYFDIDLTAEDIQLILSGEGMRAQKEGGNNP